MYPWENPVLASDMYGRVGFDISNGNLERTYQNLVAEQRAYNEHLEAREDSAVQRWAEDVKKAGLNPAIFSGSGASSTAVTSPHKSALEGLIQMLSTHNEAISNMNKDTLSAVNTGIKMALPLLAILGL